MKLFAMLIKIVISGGLVLRDAKSTGLLKYDETVLLQTLTGKANLKTATPHNCNKMCKSIGDISGHFMKCRSWIYDAWTQDCHLFKNTNPDVTETRFDYDAAEEIFENLGPALRKRISSPFSRRWLIGIDGHRYRTVRSLKFSPTSKSYQYQAAKFLTSEYSDNDINLYTIRVPALYIAPAKFPIIGFGEEWYESTAIWWINEIECSKICDLAIGCQAWTYVSRRQFTGDTVSPTKFERCFLHAKLSKMTTTENCYSSYECSFGFKHRTFGKRKFYTKFLYRMLTISLCSAT